MGNVLPGHPEALLGHNAESLRRRRDTDEAAFDDVFYRATRTTYHTGCQCNVQPMGNVLPGHPEALLGHNAESLRRHRDTDEAAFDDEDHGDGNPTSGP